MTRIVKIGFGSRVLVSGLFVLALSVTMSGCSGGQGTITAEDKKVNGMSPGDYLDSQDVKPKAKGAVRPKR